MTNKSKGLPLTLVAGQLWKTDQAYIRVLELGKRLVHYRMTKNRSQKGISAQMTGIPALESYLKSNQAKLVA
jgi:hypothetical protein